MIFHNLCQNMYNKKKHVQKHCVLTLNELLEICRLFAVAVDIIVSLNFLLANPIPGHSNIYNDYVTLSKETRYQIFFN